MAPAPGQHHARLRSSSRGDDNQELAFVAASDYTQLQVLETRLTLSPEPTGSTLREYRVHNWQRFPSGRVRRGDGGGLAWAVLCIGAALLLSDQLGWRSYELLSSNHAKAVLLGALVLIFAFQSRSVLYQSITPLPGLGIQLSTTRGFSLPRPGERWLLPLSTSRLFVPLDEVSSLIVNEALSGWEMRHYMAIIRRKGAGVEVVFDQMRQPGSLLIHVRERVLADLYA